MMMDSRTESTKLEDFTSKSDELVKWLNEHSSKGLNSNERRSRLATGCLYVALEHHKSIVLLASRSHYASAFALVRIMVQAFVQGLWIFLAASSDDLDYLVKKGKLKKEKDFAVMVKEIEKNIKNDIGALSMIKSKMYSGMSGFVHTGMVQLSRHYTDKTIEPNFSEKDIIEMLDFVNALGLWAGLRLKSASGSLNHLDQFEKKTIEYNDYAKDILNSLNSDS